MSLRDALVAYDPGLELVEPDSAASAAETLAQYTTSNVFDALAKACERAAKDCSCQHARAAWEHAARKVRTAGYAVEGAENESGVSLSDAVEAAS